MIYIHKLAQGLSSNLAPASDFPFRSLPGTNTVGANATRSMTKNSYPAHAFTFIELLVVIVVLGILFTIAYPVFIGTQERAKITKDMSNLRQIGLAAQTYMNDNDGVFPGSTTATWMSQLELNQKYLSAWGALQSPFDTRSPSETGTTAPVSPISYGINAQVYPGGIAIPADRITKPTSFILFAPAQDNSAAVAFQGTAASPPSPAQGVTVLGIGGTTPPKATSNPGGDATGGTQNSRTRINALFADLHAESMNWMTFTNNAVTASDPDGELRWKPYIPYP
jgi:prepilin-type N-terminal cleavage/methylation domain-containing protein